MKKYIAHEHGAFFNNLQCRSNLFFRGIQKCFISTLYKVSDFVLTVFFPNSVRIIRKYIAHEHGAFFNNLQCRSNLFFSQDTKMFYI